MGWAFLPNLGSGGLLVMIRGLLAMVTGDSVGSGGDLGSGLWFCALRGLALVAWGRTPHLHLF